MKIIIVGAVAGGASTAARLRRMDEKSEIIMFEKGEYMSYANCGLPYYIGNVIKNRNALFVQTAAAFHKRFHIDVRTSTEVLSIDRNSKKISAKNLISGEVYEESYDKLVLSPGAEPIRPPLQGIDNQGIFTLRNVSDTDRIKMYIQQNNIKKAVVIGAGFVGLEMAENLHELGAEVSIVEMANQILAPVDFPIAALLQQHIRSKGVKLLLNTTVTGFEVKNKQINVQLKNASDIETDLVILSIGVKPETKLAAEAGLKIGQTRGIWVNEYLQTSDPDIYAVGDAIEFPNPITKQAAITFLAGPANKQGRICADNIVDNNTHQYKGAINTAIVKVFDMTVAVTGMASKNLQKADIKHLTSTTISGSHAGYYPGAKQMVIQVVFSPETGQLFGAQVAGFTGVDKRLDILASVVQRMGTIHELTEFEHAYAPPFSSAKDPVNMAAFVAENILNKKSKVFYWNELDKIGETDIFVDVRTEKEHENGKIPNTINIPVDELRNRLNELPKNKTIYVHCQIGLRGYIAQRILLQNGFNNVINLSGGFMLWEACKKES